MTAMVAGFCCRGCESASTELVLSLGRLPLARLFARQDLGIRDLAHIPAQGGSLRLRVAHGADGPRSAPVGTLLAEETRWLAGYDTNAKATILNYFGIGSDPLDFVVDAILRQHGECRRRGGHFIRPVPTVTIL